MNKLPLPVKTAMLFAAIILFAGCGRTTTPKAAPLPELPISVYTLEDIQIRDPYIMADQPSGTYYLYSSASQPEDRPNGRNGVKMYKSKDLASWEGPYLVYEIPEDSWANPEQGIWAPEVHSYKGKYYLFATLHDDRKLHSEETPYGVTQMMRGTQVFVSDKPEGPFAAFGNKPHTPMEWMALDGTLWAEKGRPPYMVFCHEWVQTGDGTMDYVELEKDLSAPASEPKMIFSASEGSWVRPVNDKGGYVTDGCFLYRTKTGKLMMIWSSFGDNGYAVSTASSGSGEMEGPWVQSDELIFSENGGHGMLFETFDGRLMIALHYPNSGATPHTKLFELEDTGDGLRRK